jgi:deoxyribose-phosphate aldolase
MPEVAEYGLAQVCVAPRMFVSGSECWKEKAKSTVGLGYPMGRRESASEYASKRNEAIRTVRGNGDEQAAY